MSVSLTGNFLSRPFARAGAAWAFLAHCHRPKGLRSHSERRSPVKTRLKFPVGLVGIDPITDAMEVSR
jgi:hypothetical protein